MSFISSLSAYKIWSKITCIERYYFICHFLNKKLTTFYFRHNYDLSIDEIEVNLCSLTFKTCNILIAQVYCITKPVQALVKENSSLIKLRSFCHFEILFPSDDHQNFRTVQWCNQWRIQKFHPFTHTLCFLWQ